MKLDFNDIAGAHTGRTAIVLAHGPSLNAFDSQVGLLVASGAVVIAVNDWRVFHPQIHPDYVVVANNVYTVAREYREFNDFAAVVVYADSVDLTDEDDVSRLLTVDYLPFDQRHFGGRPCSPPSRCCDRARSRRTIQEELQVSTGSPSRYGSGDTVTLHAAALGVIAGCDRVCVLGMDMDYSLGFATMYAPKDMSEVELDDFDIYRDRAFADLKIIEDSAAMIGVCVERWTPQGGDHHAE